MEDASRCITESVNATHASHVPLTPEQVHVSNDTDAHPKAESSSHTPQAESITVGESSSDDDFQATPCGHVEIDLQHIVRLSLWSSLPIVVLDGLVRLIDLFGEESQGACDERDSEEEEEVGSHKVDFLFLGGPLAVLRAMRRHIDSVEIQVAGCFALIGLLGDHSVSQYWYTYLGCGLGAVKHLVAMLEEWYDSVPLQEVGYHLLLRLTCTSPINAKEFCEVGGIDVVLKRVTQYPKSSHTKADVISLLKNLCQWEEARTVLVESGMVTCQSSSCYQDTSESTSVASAATASTLASASDSIRRCGHPIDPATNDSVSDSSSHTAALEETVIFKPGPALHKRGKSRAYRRCFVVELPSEEETARATDDVKVLQDPFSRTLLNAISVDLWQDDDYAVEMALEQMRVLSRMHSSRVLSMLLMGIGPLALIKLLERKSFTDTQCCTTVFQLTCHLIHTLAEQLDGFHLLFSDLNVVEVLVSSLRRVSEQGNHKLLKPGFDAVRELLKTSDSSPDVVDPFVVAGGIDLLVQYMRSHPRKSSVQLSSCKLLAYFSTTHQRELIKAGAMGALMAVFENHLDHPKALSAAKRVIQDFV
jgi:hypothetical protein